MAQPGPVRTFAYRQAARGLLAVSSRLSASKGRGLADRLAGLLYRSHPRMREIVLHNLHMAFGDTMSGPDLDTLARESYRNLCRTAVEVGRMSVMSPADVIAQVEVHGIEHLDRALALGRGAIMLTAHYGNWELMGARVAHAGYPSYVVARDHGDPMIARILNGIRTRHRMNIISRDETKGTLECLRHNGVLGILADQNTAEGGVFVYFFGHPASAPVGPALLAMRTGAAVMPAFITRDEDFRHHVRIHPPIELVRTGRISSDVAANTALMTLEIERQIRAKPSEWFWVHKRWELARKLEPTDEEGVFRWAPSGLRHPAQPPESRPDLGDLRPAPPRRRPPRNRWPGK